MDEALAYIEPQGKREKTVGLWYIPVVLGIEEKERPGVQDQPE
jgi:hypothetical protein